MEVFPTKQVGKSSINWSILDKKLTTVPQQGWNPHFSLWITLRLTRYKLSFPPHWHRRSWGSCGVWSPCNWRTHSSPSTPQSAYPKLWSPMTTVFQRRVNQYNPATSQAFRNSGQTKTNPGVQTPITTSLTHICTVCHVGWCGTQKKSTLNCAVKSSWFNYNTSDMYIYTVGQREEGSRDSKGWSRAGKKGTLAYNPLCTVKITKATHTVLSLSLTLNSEGSREDRFRAKQVCTRETETDVRKYAQEHREVNKRLGHAALTLICTLLQQGTPFQPCFKYGWCIQPWWEWAWRSGDHRQAGTAPQGRHRCIMTKCCDCSLNGVNIFPAAYFTLNIFNLYILSSKSLLLLWHEISFFS